MASYAEIKAKLQQEGKKIRKRLSYDEHNLQAAEVRYIRGDRKSTRLNSSHVD